VIYFSLSDLFVLAPSFLCDLYAFAAFNIAPANVGFGFALGKGALGGMGGIRGRGRRLRVRKLTPPSPPFCPALKTSPRRPPFRFEQDAVFVA